jgi:hypothetical protein
VDRTVVERSVRYAHLKGIETERGELEEATALAGNINPKGISEELAIKDFKFWWQKKNK